MAIYQIDWDEENSPRAFAWWWGVCQFLVLLAALRAKAHLFIGFMPHLQSENPDLEKLVRFIGLVPFMVVALLYLNLVFNGLWHRNPDLPDPEDEDPGSQRSSSVALQVDGPEEENLSPPGLFEQSLLKDPDPIVMRDQIQWKRMFLATIAMTFLVGSLVLNW
jgi:hypothetical protein